MITEADRVANLIRPREKEWRQKAISLIGRKFGDALAHAHKALTDTLRDAEDGRPTLRKALRSPSFKAACTRLEELADDLAGHRANSLAGLIREARAAFYRDSVDIWRREIPEELWASDELKPTIIGESTMQGLVIDGRDVRTDVKGAIDTAIRQLQAAVTQAARRGIPVRTGEQILNNWHRRQIDAVQRVVTSILTTSNVAVHQATGRLMVHPDFHAED